MEMCLRDKITSTEYDMLHAWRDWYAWGDEKSDTARIKPIRDILQEWDNSNKDLCTLLGGELMVTKGFEFCKAPDELRDEMFAVIDHRACYGRTEREGWKFIEAYHKWYDEAFPVHKHYWHPWENDEPLTAQQEEENRVNIPIRNGLNELVSTYTLVENKYDDEEFTLLLPSGKSYVVRNGCKPMKALAKIAEAFNLPYFEDFRICHSQVHNQKRIKGDLTLSIHPLDYWTMSDNDCGWESCMNWSDYGGYRQGTVEMMNSPCVVVAYLSSSEQMPIGTVGEWNNKKWRQLFIVHKDVILGIKAYPYKNDDLSGAAMKWLKELAEQNLGWKYLSDEPEKWTSSTSFTNPNFPEDGEFKFGFYSNHMYTDVGCMDWHPIYVGAEVQPKLFPTPIRKMDFPLYDFNYSGAAMCVSCGELDPDLCDDSYLCCGDCEDTFRCSQCGDRIYHDDAYRVGDCYLCHYCWEEHTQECNVCEESDFTDNFVSVRILPKLDDDLREWAERKYGDRPTGKGWQDYEIAFPGWDIEMCDRCLANLEDEFLKPGAKKFTFQSRYGGIWYGVYFDDLNEDGIDRFCNWRFQDDYEHGMSMKDLIKKYWEDDVAWIRTPPEW